MQRFILSRRALVSLISIVFLVVATLGVSIFVNQASAANASNTYVSLSKSFTSTPAGAHLKGAHASKDQLTITLVLQPNNAAGMNSLLAALYNPSSAQFHHWLTQGEFNQLFAPTASQNAQVSNFLKTAGLKLASSPSPFLMRATGSTAQVEAAFRTSVNDYTAANGQRFFQNASAIQIPASLSNIVTSVSGLYNTVRLHSDYVITREAAQHSGKAVPHYGAGPGGSGLTPSQTASLYNATPVYQLGSRGEGKGATLAVFELSGYTESDITAYEHQFFGASENVKLVNINVDGGPVTPVCPVNDICGPNYDGSVGADYSGDIEVEADLETQIGLAPKINRVLVYNAPNDETGQTGVDEYFRIANDDQANSISTSWGDCESVVGFGVAQEESVAFEQMAFQGQSMFAAAGDDGAFDCLGVSPDTNPAVDDPGSDPFVNVCGRHFLGYI